MTNKEKEEFNKAQLKLHEGTGDTIDKYCETMDQLLTELRERVLTALMTAFAKAYQEFNKKE